MYTCTCTIGNVPFVTFEVEFDHWADFNAMITPIWDMPINSLLNTLPTNITSLLIVDNSDKDKSSDDITNLLSSFKQLRIFVYTTGHNLHRRPSFSVTAFKSMPSLKTIIVGNDDNALYNYRCSKCVSSGKTTGCGAEIPMSPYMIGYKTNYCKGAYVKCNGLPCCL